MGLQKRDKLKQQKITKKKKKKKEKKGTNINETVTMKSTYILQKTNERNYVLDIVFENGHAEET